MHGWSALEARLGTDAAWAIDPQPHSEAVFYVVMVRVLRGLR
jgi:hypothetical protein